MKGTNFKVQFTILFRALVNQQRRLEKESYLVTKQLQEDPTSESLIAQRESLEQQVRDFEL